MTERKCLIIFIFYHPLFKTTRILQLPNVIGDVPEIKDTTLILDAARDLIVSRLTAGPCNPSIGLVMSPLLYPSSGTSLIRNISA